MMITYLTAFFGLALATFLGWLLAWWSRGDKIEYWQGLFEQKEMDYNTLDADYHTTNKKVKGLEQDVRSYNAKIAPLNDEISALKSDVNNRDEIIANFKEQDWETRYNSVKFDADKRADELVKLRANIDPLNNEIAQLKKKNDTSVASIQDLKNQLEEWRKKYDNVTPDLKSAKDEAGELKIKMVSKDSYIEELKAKVNAANEASTANADLQNQFNALQANFNAIQPERDQYKTKAGELETQMAELKNKTSNLESTNGDLLKQLEEAKAKANSSNGAITQELEQLRAAKQKLTDDLNQCNNQSNTLRSELESAKASVANAPSSDQLAGLQAEKGRLAQELASVTAKVASAPSGDELARLQADNQSLKAELEALKAKAAAAPPPPPAPTHVEPELDEEDAKDETLVRIREKAKNIDFGRLGVASRAEKDDLKEIKGIGPYIEKKLNALGIYRFEQISRFNDEDIDKVNDAIEFFPGRVRRDDWKGQAGELKNK